MSTFNVTELNNLFNQINQVSDGSLNSTKLGKGYNDIAWFANAITTASSEETTPEQKASAIQGMIQKVLNIFEKIINNEAKAAKKETKEETKKSQELVEKSKNLETKLNSSLTDIQDNIEKQAEIITETQNSLEETKESIEEKQAQVDEFVKQIEEQKNKLASAKTPEEKAEILAKIQGFTNNIAGIGVTIEVDAETIRTLTTAIESTVINVEDLTQKLSETKQTGIQELGEQAYEAAKLSTDVAETGTKGTTNEVTAIAIEQAATAANSNFLTGTSIAPKLYQTANDQRQASSTRLTSIAQNVNNIAQGIGGLSNATQVLAGFQHSIGSALNNYSELYGQWDAQLQPAIVSLGSFSTLANATEELNTAVETDLGNLGFEVEEDGSVQKTEQKDDKNNDENSKKGENVELETEKFDIEKLRSFGI